MKLVLIWLGVISVVELLMWTAPLWQWRKALASVLIVSLSVASGLLFGLHFVLWAGVFLVLSVYRLINLLRVIEARLQPDYLYHATRRTSQWLIAMQLLLLGLAAWQRTEHQSALFWLFTVAILQFFFAALLFASTWRHLRTTKAPVDRAIADQDLPTLSVAIPARNETEDLEACLQSLIGSSYPKLEILVLDDCSQNSRTPEIIRAYAHDGVRFIAGKTPPRHWLAKNYAYQQLADEANGELFLFCGVDTRFQPESLSSIVKAILVKNKQMVSFIPRNKTPRSWSLEALMIQPARYAWELSLPRRLFNRPPVLSTCWIIKSSALRAAGGFQATSNSISVESYFAKATLRDHDGYSFIQSDKTIDLTSSKSLLEQRATAIRTRYPQLHRRPELVALFVLAELALLTLPYIFLPIIFGQHDWLLLSISIVNCTLLSAFYARIVSLTYRDFLLRGVWLLPFVAVYDLGLLNYSMWQYEFREVIWKNRNICIPLMRVIPKLPRST